jgi:hypothetical protein
MRPAAPDPDEIMRTMGVTVARLRMQLAEAANVQLATALPNYRKHSVRLARPGPAIRPA